MQIATLEMKQIKTTVQEQKEELKASVSALQSQASSEQSLKDIERRLSSLEVRPVEQVPSTVTFADDVTQISMTTFERVQVLESK